jgi:co-chaperonin GroES (HSP10)
MKFTKFQPYGKRVVLKLDTPEQVTEGGIIIPDSHQRPSTTATVISFGDKCEKVREGVHIIIPEEVANGAQEIMIKDEKYILTLEDLIDGEID